MPAILQRISWDCMVTFYQSLTSLLFNFVIGNSANSLLISKFALLFDMFYETLHGLVVII